MFHILSANKFYSTHSAAGTCVDTSVPQHRRCRPHPPTPMSRTQFLSARRRTQLERVHAELSGQHAERILELERALIEARETEREFSLSNDVIKELSRMLTTADSAETDRIN